MARSLGSLIVNLGLNAAEFTTGLTKAEAQAKKFARDLDREFDSIKTAALKFAVLGASAIAAFKLIETGANGIAAFKTLSEQIGDTSNAVAGLKVSAATSGVAMEEIAAASVKLTAALSKTDDESKGAGKAIKALGLDLETFKQLSPVTQLEATAKALAGFEDGASKTAVAVALFGKTGASLIPFLNDLADAGGRNERLTREQIEAADQFTKQLARLREESSLAAQSFVSDLIPSVSRLIAEFTEGKKIAGGFWQALVLFGTTNPFRTAQESIDNLRKSLKSLEEKKAGKGIDLFGDIDGQIAAVKKKIEFALFQQRTGALSLIDPSNADARDLRLQQKPKLAFDAGGGSAAAAAKATKEVISEAQRYVEQLEKQLERTQELTTVEQALRDIQMGRIEGLTPALADVILKTAQQIDQAKEAKKIAEEQKRIDEEAARIRERNSQALTKEIEATMREAQAARDQNETLREHLIMLKGGEVALNAYTDAKLAAIIAEKEHKAAQLANAEASQAQIDAIYEVIAALRERQDILKQTDFAAQMKKEAEALQEVKNLFSDTFADAFADFVSGTKSAKDAFKSFADDLVRQITRIASQNLANAIFGGNNSAGPDIFGVLTKIIGGAFGGSGAPSGDLAFAFAGGTDFAPGGLALVGERGPELVSLPRGSKVTPNHQLGGNVVNITQHINVMPGANTQSARQAALAAGDAVARVSKRR